MNNSDRSIIFIMGMHRSGTSALAGALYHAGFEFDGNLLPSSDENPNGFFESEEVNAINDGLLNGLGQSWFDSVPLPSNWQNTPAAETAYQCATFYIKRLLQQSDAKVMVIKDPRLCLTLPIWLRTCKDLHITPYAVLIIREPTEVMASLYHRNRLAPAASLQLYIKYNNSVLQHIAPLSKNSKITDTAHVNLASQKSSAIY